MSNELVGIIDYGIGNLKSVENAVKFYDKTIKVDLVKRPESLKKYSKVILPGVGAFADAIAKIKEKKFDEAIFEEVTKGKHILGICLGMQLLATKSYEYGEHEGLNIIEGEVRDFKQSIDLRVPHIGWNEVEFVYDDGIIKDVVNPSEFYFVHSYYYDCRDKDSILGLTNYGIKFPSVIKKGNVYGVQFHPEKSQEMGLKFIKNFLELN